MDHLILQQPEAPAELLLLFHGVGSNAEDLRPLGSYLAEARPQCAVVSVQSPDRSEMGSGWQWFSVRGITDENRPARVDAALPVFVRTVHELQRSWGIAADQRR